MSTSYDILLDADTWDDRVFRCKHDCINDWLQSKHSTGASRRTLNAYSRTACKFFHDHFPDTHPAEVTVGDIEQYVRMIDERDGATNTKRRYVESLSSFYDWAMKRPRFEEITANPGGVVLEEIDRGAGSDRTPRHGRMGSGLSGTSAIPATRPSPCWLPKRVSGSMKPSP